MYHYVRPLEKTRFPQIKGLDYAGFERQLNHLEANYQVLDLVEFLAIMKGEADLYRDAALLTFDDGFRDHYDYVLPLLYDRGIQGLFYPPSAPVLDHELLDVHRLHFILASNPDPEELRELCHILVKEHLGDEYMQATAAELNSGRFDTAEVLLFKRLLQRDLPRSVRRQVTGELFAKAVTHDEAAFAEELYMNPAQLKHMVSSGMHVGSHSDTHEWLSKISVEEQTREIERSLQLLEGVGAAENWTLAYPYGDFDSSTLKIAGDRGCAAAFTTVAGPVTVRPDNLLTVERLDTNEFPR